MSSSAKPASPLPKDNPQASAPPSKGAVAKAGGTRKKSSKLPRQVTPARPTVDKAVVDELLLVCSVIGSHDDETGNFVPVTDCLQWLQDLQRALRRDDDITRAICLLVGDWKVVEQKLLPLCAACRYDTQLLLTVCKILVLLTKPLSVATQRAAVMPIATKSSKSKNPLVIREQIKLRDNALQQAAQLMEYKRVLCQADGFFAILVSLLAEPLAKARRTEQEHLSIEIVLHLLRNILAAQPVLRDDEAAVVHQRLVQVLERELVLDIICVLAADLDQPHSPNAAYNLLLMEILQHLVLPFKVEHVITAGNDPKAERMDATKDEGTTEPRTSAKQPYVPTGGAGALRNSLLRERRSAQSMIAARHGNFGGSLVLGDAKNADAAVEKSSKDLTNWTVSTTQFAQAALGRTNTSAGTTVQAKKRAPVFVGALPTRVADVAATPSARLACAAIARFGKRFMADCFAPWAKSLKNEFRRDSVRLEDGDRVVWLQLVAYWSKFWRGLKKKPDKKKHSAIGPLVFAMDVFSFHLVHNAADTFSQHKEHGKLAHSIGLLKEMMLLLQILYDASDETEQIMAMGLLDRLFYGTEPLDRLPKLLSLWQPGQASHQYAADLAELVHTQIKLLERHADACKELADPESAKNRRKKKKDTGVTDTIMKMKMVAADFDVSSYVRKLATPHNVSLYTHLLSKYAVNGNRLNHRIITFLLRIAQFKIVVPETLEDGTPRNPLANYEVITLEPMLYNIRLLWVLHCILNDAAAVRDKQLQTVVQFAVRIVSRFATASQENPLLLVEGLVKHTAAHRHCEAAMTHYVSEELVMLAERDLLLEEQENWEGEYNPADEDGDDEGPTRGVSRQRHHNDSDSEDEVEFDDGLVEAVPSASKEKSKRKAILDDSEDEEGGIASDKEETTETPRKKQRTDDEYSNNDEMQDEKAERDDELADEKESHEKDSTESSPKKRINVGDASESEAEEDGEMTNVEKDENDETIVQVESASVSHDAAENDDLDHPADESFRDVAETKDTEPPATRDNAIQDDMDASGRIDSSTE